MSNLTLNRWLVMITIITAPALTMSGWALADETVPEFHIIIATPNQCVALNKGQRCYQDVVIEWRSPKAGHFCVRSTQVSTPLRCWQNDTQGSIALSVEAEQSVLFTLHDQPADTKLAEALMRVAWVYQQNRRKIASWRLF